MVEKTLVIAEKPSAAGDIARALGKMERDKNYYENEEYIVSSAVGHLLEIVPPENVEVKRGKWSLVNLPVLPDNFLVQPIKTTTDRLRVLKRLYNRKDVGQIINACDAGREGELIFFNLMRYLGDKKPKPIHRLWLQSMTPASIRRGFDTLRANTEMLPLQRAAVCRAEADWLIGINSTRAMTALHSAAGGFFLTTVGRVQTPTLAIIIEREEQIRSFKAQPYWEVRATFAGQAGAYEGVWHDTTETQKKPERIFVRQTVDDILQACDVGSTGIVTETVKPTSESPPMLFDLTTLQREGNNRFGMSAKGTLATAQALYERHKLITYPRTDSRALPEDYPQTVAKTLAVLAKEDSFGEHAKRVLDNSWIKSGNRRIFNNAKISDHFAIIPTGEAARPTLRDNERKLYDAIVRRFIAAFYPPAKFLITNRKTQIGEHCFVSKGKVMKDAGWRAVTVQTGKDSELPPVNDREVVTVRDIQAEDKITTPPPRYNEATLLSAMEGAGKLVDEEELREAMQERGLGTPATRAAIIEGLLRERYLLRDQRNLLPTPKAHSLIRLLSTLNAEALTKPALTGEWEYKLRQIERENGDSQQFMGEIRALTEAIVTAAKSCGDVENIPGDFVTLKTPCPLCGSKVQEKHRRFVCAKCDFFIWKAMGAREFSVAEVEILLANGETDELEGFRSRLGREFSARVKLQKDEKGMLRAAFNFGQNETEMITLNAEELAQHEAVGACPKCSATVRVFEGRYLCEKTVGSTPTCDFSMSKRILQQEVSVEQMRLLLKDGKTAVLEKFISKKTNRPFKARLAMNLTDKTGKLAFEFAAPSTKKRRPPSRASS